MECLAYNWDDLTGIYADLFMKDKAKVQSGGTIDKNKKWVFRAEKRPKNKSVDCTDCKCSVCEAPNVVFRTSLEKAFLMFKISDCIERQKWEKDLIRQFKRRVHHYVSDISIPEAGDILEWLALIRHYFGPVRLLDCTYSFFVGCYFAINELDSDKELAEVWAIDANWLSYEDFGAADAKDQRIARIIGALNYQRCEQIAKERSQQEDADRDTTLANKIAHFLMNNPKACVYNVTPFRVNERVITQRSTFLLQGDVSKCFLWNLKQTLDSESLERSKDKIVRVVIKFPNLSARIMALRELDEIGINQSVLFPDLRGFAESLIRRLAFPDRRNPR